MWLLTGSIAFGAIGTTTFHIITVLTKTEQKPAISALTGLVPVIEWWFILVCCFGFTDAAWEHTGVINVGFVFVYSLLNCRQIVTNMTR